jgi:hypothetical protein
MKVGRASSFHLTYCTNVHPGERWEATFENLKTYVPELKRQLSPEAPFGVGLRLSNRAARELLQNNRLSRFKRWLDEQRLYVFTINGFPYGHFHRQVVKDRAYAPDWRTRDRVDYTLHLVRILAALLPSDMEGSISTSPLSYKPWLNEEAARQDAFRKGSVHLADVAAELVRLRERTDTLLHIDLEPEPDCLIEDAAETVSFVEDWLLPVGGAHLAEQLGVSQEEAANHLLRHIRVCYDTCHFAVEYEDPETALARLKDAGIRLGKMHLSAALKVPLPEQTAGRREVGERLRPLAEATYLHQVIERRTDGRFHRYPDLPVALDHIQREEACEWRIHYHVPLFMERYGALLSTQSDLLESLAWVRREKTPPHLEIETYTWDVLPSDMKETSLLDSIRREYDWVLSCLERPSERAPHE